VFTFLCLLASALTFRIVAPGVTEGFLPALPHGLGPALHDFAVVGVREGLDHVFYHLPDRIAPLYLHMVFGTLALMLLPLQVARRLRLRRPGVHRWVGRAMIFSVLVASASSLPLAVNMEIPRWGIAGYITGGIVWFVCGAMALVHALRGEIDRHRRWALLTAAMTFGAVVLRIEFPIMRIWLSSQFTWAAVGWIGWMPQMIVVLAWLRWRDGARRAVRPASAPRPA
jgi:hypothetical protein